MKKQFLATLIFLFIVLSAFSMVNTSIAQENKCGDNVCDEFENANPNVCPTDCPFQLITVKTEETSLDFWTWRIEKIFDDAIDLSRGLFPFTFLVALIFSLWISFSFIKNKKISIFWLFFIPIFIYGGLIIHTARGDDFGLGAFFAFITACIALFINYVILIVYLLIKPDWHLYMKKILVIMAIVSLIFLIFTVFDFHYLFF